MRRVTDIARTLVDHYQPDRVDLDTGVHVFRAGLGWRCLGLVMWLGSLTWVVWELSSGFIHGFTTGAIWVLAFLLLALGGWRTWRVNVRVTPQEIVVRNVERTYRIPASEVSSINLGRKQQGDTGSALVWLPYLERVDGSVVWMPAIQGGGGLVPSEQMLRRVNAVRRVLGVDGVDYTQRLATPIWRRSNFKRKL